MCRFTPMSPWGLMPTNSASDRRFYFMRTSHGTTGPLERRPRDNMPTFGATVGQKESGSSLPITTVTDRSIFSFFFLVPTSAPDAGKCGSG